MTSQRRARLAALALAVALLGACGSAPEPSEAGGTEPSITGPEPAEQEELQPAEQEGPGGLTPPPPVTVGFLDGSVELSAWTFCYKTGCADGAPPADPPDVGSPEEVTVEFPLQGWSFTASFSPAGEECGRIQHVPLEQTGAGTFVLRPAGYAGTYDVTLFGQGNGDLFVTFRWTTPTDGPRPVPEARLAVLADHDGRVDSYGIEFEVANLAATPQRASAVITVRAADGNDLTFQAKGPARGCRPEGTLYWDGPDRKGLAAASLGEGPFTYEVVLTLDGVRYEASARWPEDEIAGNEPSVVLNFTPSLPALR
jgi:hypothetical protein